MSGSGVLTLVVENVPQVVYNVSTGALSPDSIVSVRIGDIFAKLRRVVFSDPNRLSVEVQLPGAVTMTGNLAAQVAVQVGSSSPLASVATFSLRILDDRIDLVCLTGGCSGPVNEGEAFFASLGRFPLTAASFSEVLTMFFGDMPMENLEFVNSTSRLSVVRVTPPSYTCAACQLTSGFATVLLRAVYIPDSTVIATTPYTFWGSPLILSAEFDASGTRLIVNFDQATNRAGMIDSRESNRESCDDLFANAAKLVGSDARCVWSSNNQLTVFLGREASVTTGSTLRVLESAELRSSNGISRPCVASIVVTAPMRVPPAVVLKSVDVIDAC
jgi:hypothetical protein